MNGSFIGYVLISFPSLLLKRLKMSAAGLYMASVPCFCVYFELSPAILITFSLVYWYTFKF